MITRKMPKPYTGSYRVTIPILFIETLGIIPGDKIRIDLKDNSIILTPVTSTVLQDRDVTEADATTFRGGHD